MGLLEPLRKWIDGEENDLLEAQGFQPRPRRTAEEFLVALAREIGAVMEYEMFTPPGGLTYIPREYILFLSSDDDKEWRGEKRRGLESGLFNALRLKAQQLCKHTQLSAHSFTVEMRIDGTLAKGQFRVKAVWDIEPDKTSVSSRPVKLATDLAAGGVSVAEETTEIRSRPRIVFYSLEVWRDCHRQTIFPVTKPEITIGRGSQFVHVDLEIKGDPEVSRLHVLIAREASGICWLTAKGQNPVLVNGMEMTREGRMQVKTGDEITIASFLLRIQ